MKMRNILSLILIWFSVFTGCITRERCLEKYPPEVKESQTLTEKIILKDTIIYKPGEAVGLSVNLDSLCDLAVAEALKSKTINGDHLQGSINVRNGRVYFKCKEDSLLAVNATLKSKYTELSKTKLTVVEKQVFKTHWYDPPARVLALLLLGLLIFKVARYTRPFT